MKVYEKLAYALASCCSRRPEVAEENWDLVTEIAKKYLPSGSGFDCGCQVLIKDEWKNRIVIELDFHSMDEHGVYEGWIHYRATVVPDFHGFRLTVRGRDHRGLREYVEDSLYQALDEEYDE